jgi:hypothetical protein
MILEIVLQGIFLPSYFTIIPRHIGLIRYILFYSFIIFYPSYSMVPAASLSSLSNFSCLLALLDGMELRQRVITTIPCTPPPAPPLLSPYMAI